MGDVELAVGLAVEEDGLDVALAVADAGGLDLEGAAVRQREPGVGDVGRTKHVLVRAGADGVEAEGAEDVPG